MIRCVRTPTQIRHTDTANRIATCSDSKRIRTQNARSIHRSDVDTWGFSSSVAWQSFEVVPNVIGPTSSTCERVVHQPAVVHYYVFSVFPSIIYNKCSLPALHHNYPLPLPLFGGFWGVTNPKVLGGCQTTGPIGTKFGTRLRIRLGMDIG